MADDRTTIRVTRGFLSKPEKVYDAWLTPAIATKFLFSTPDGEMQKVEIDAKEGGTFTVIEKRKGEDIEHTGTYEKLQRPDRIIFTFAVPKYSTEETRVTLDITPDGNGSQITLVHEGVLRDYAEKTENGWTKMLNGLAAVVMD